MGDTQLCKDRRGTRIDGGHTTFPPWGRSTGGPALGTHNFRKLGGLRGEALPGTGNFLNFCRMGRAPLGKGRWMRAMGESRRLAGSGCSRGPGRSVGAAGGQAIQRPWGQAIQSTGSVGAAGGQAIQRPAERGEPGDRQFRGLGASSSGDRQQRVMRAGGGYTTPAGRAWGQALGIHGSGRTSVGTGSSRGLRAGFGSPGRAGRTRADRFAGLAIRSILADDRLRAAGGRHTQGGHIHGGGQAN